MVMRSWAIILLLITASCESSDRNGINSVSNSSGECYFQYTYTLRDDKSIILKGILGGANAPSGAVYDEVFPAEVRYREFLSSIIKLHPDFLREKSGSGRTKWICGT